MFHVQMRISLRTSPAFASESGLATGCCGASAMFHVQMRISLRPSPALT